MRYIMALLLSLALAVPAFAGFEGPNASTGGFAGPGPQTITKAAQVQNALDDTTCKGIFWNASAKTSMYFRMTPER